MERFSLFESKFNELSGVFLLKVMLPCLDLSMHQSSNSTLGGFFFTLFSQIFWQNNIYQFWTSTFEWPAVHLQVRRDFVIQEDQDHSSEDYSDFLSTLVFTVKYNTFVYLAVMTSGFLYLLCFMEKNFFALRKPNI